MVHSQQSQVFGNAKVSVCNSQTLLNKPTGFINAYDFTLNPYRGCQYGCSYCYAAAFSPNSKMRQDWGNWVMVKQNAVQLLDKELARWDQKNPDRPPSIYMSTVTDPYQPIETREKLTRQLLAVLVRYQPTLVIQTRSPLITRDIDLLCQFQRLRINMSIPTGSEEVKQDFEGRSPSITARLKAISNLRYNIPDRPGHEIKFSVTITPLLPTLPADESRFINKLAVLDRVVIQEFHATHFHDTYSDSMIASTPQEAIALKQKYSWWYDREKRSYDNFKQSLIAQLEDVEIMEGKQGFGYE